MSVTTVQQETALRREALHAGIVDPDMDSMRLLSETAMKFPEALSFSSGAPHDGTHDLGKLSSYVDRYIAHLRERGCPNSASHGCTSSTDR